MGKSYESLEFAVTLSMFLQIITLCSRGQCMHKPGHLVYFPHIFNTYFCLQNNNEALSPLYFLSVAQPLE